MWNFILQEIRLNETAFLLALNPMHLKLLKAELGGGGSSSSDNNKGICEIRHDWFHLPQPSPCLLAYHLIAPDKL